MRFSTTPLAIVALVPAACGAPSVARPADTQATAGVRAVVAEQLGLPFDRVTRNSRLIADLGADSLDLVEIVMAIEDKFGIAYSDEEASKVSTVGDMIDYVAAHRKK